MGTHLIKKLREERGYKNIYIAELPEYDLRSIDDIKKMFDEQKPDIVIHLAAVVGGIGAGALNKLVNSGAKVYRAETGTVSDNLDKFIGGALAPHLVARPDANDVRLGQDGFLVQLFDLRDFLLLRHDHALPSLLRNCIETRFGRLPTSTQQPVHRLGASRDGQ